jgi:hypothetical protein
MSVASDLDGQKEVFVERAARLREVEVGQGRVVRPAGRDEQVIDRIWQLGEELLACSRIESVEGDGSARPDLAPGVLEPLRVAGRKDHFRALPAGQPSRREADAGAAADDDDGLARQLRLGPSRRLGRRFRRHGFSVRGRAP